MEVLNRYDRGAVKGPPLIEKLQANQLPSRQERIFFVNVLSEYLMENSLTYVQFCVHCQHYYIALQCIVQCARDLNDPNQQNEIFRIAKQMVKERQDIAGSNCLKGVSGKVIMGMCCEKKTMIG